jgi:hypothetical protein
MTSQSARHSVLKVFRDPAFRNLPTPYVKVGVIQPAVQPSFLIAITANYSRAEDSLHITIDGDEASEFVTFTWLSYFSEVEVPVTAIIKIDVDLPKDKFGIMTYVEAGGKNARLAKLMDRAGLIDIENLDERCEVINTLRYDLSEFKQFFVGGAPKSGTTWVKHVLNAHPKVLATSENAFMDFPSVDWIQRAAEDQRPWTRGEATVMNPPFSNITAMFGFGRAALTLRQLATISDIGFVGDKTPENSMHIDYFLSLFSNATFIHCIRHPFDVVVSRAFHEASLWAGGGIGSPLKAASGQRLLNVLSSGQKPAVGELLDDVKMLKGFLWGWCEYNNLAQSALARWGVRRFHIVRYEELVSNPEASVRDLFHAVGVETSPEERATIIDKTGFKTMSGGRDPGEEDIRSFFRKGVTNDYLLHVNAAQQAFCTRYIKNNSVPEVHEPYLGR